MRNTFLVCYDICDDRRLAKVHKTMRGFGDHLQYSIFECLFNAADLARCRHRLSALIHHDESAWSRLSISADDHPRPH